MKSMVINYEMLGYSVAESYKSLRTNLFFCGEDKKIIAVTSCTPNEGKTNVSFYLSVSLAQAGKRVLLINADLRKPVHLEKIQVEGELKGLSHYLSQQASLSSIVYNTNIPKFHMIHSGAVPPNPTELLGSTYFKQLLDSLREVYDYVIIDTPPLGSVIDGAVIAEECDGSILVIESGVISYRFAQEVKEQLEKCDCPILGVVLNKVDMNKNHYYGKYYGKHYGKYYGKYGEYGKEK